ncbi:ABC transporter permease [Streptomyces sp. NPDC004126]|uniref:ABC transporter permease n=1 Tax=Streptomyces sp. NPDC004126 TaxID=3390695 RepID=UPI003D05D98A
MSLAYLRRRTLLALCVLCAAYSVSFGILYVLPGDPVEIMAAGGDGTPADAGRVAELRHAYGFDRPLAAQYAQGALAALRGDLGRSVQSGRPVAALIGEALPETLSLAAAALVLGLGAGTAAALGATYTRRTWLRRTLSALPAGGAALPPFLVGLVLLHVVSFRWGLIPAFGDGGIAVLVLPAVTLALPCAALVAQVLAGDLERALGEPYTRTARAKGVSRVRVHLRHALPEALPPALALAGTLAGNTVASATVVETVFSRPGVGRLLTGAVHQQDIPVVQGVVLVGAVVFVAAGLLVDVLGPLLDPRACGTGRAGA